MSLLEEVYNHLTCHVLPSRMPVRQDGETRAYLTREERSPGISRFEHDSPHGRTTSNPKPETAMNEQEDVEMEDGETKDGEISQANIQTSLSRVATSPGTSTEQGEHATVIVPSGNKSCYLHRAILASRCDYFDKALKELDANKAERCGAAASSDAI
ncbi:hypothetical protein F4780DRAFT_740538 [Xylariomycetidae sp. FL0641]|nr:hypothetical protein F4780DRAFT_740538 [Xylariomycetidae sp. FL0641]